MALYVDIEKKCGDFLLKVKFTAEKEVLGLLGASGCGKSMTLKCIAGIEKPDKGVIQLDDKVFLIRKTDPSAGTEEESRLFISGLCTLPEYDGAAEYPVRCR